MVTFPWFHTNLEEPGPSGPQQESILIFSGLLHCQPACHCLLMPPPPPLCICLCSRQPLAGWWHCYLRLSQRERERGLSSPWPLGRPSAVVLFAGLYQPSAVSEECLVCWSPSSLPWHVDISRSCLSVCPGPTMIYSMHSIPHTSVQWSNLLAPQCSGKSV